MSSTSTANKENESMNSNTDYTKQPDCFAYCNSSDTTNADSSTSQNRKFFKIFKYLMRSTSRLIQIKRRKFIIKKQRSISTLCRSNGEKITSCTSLSSVVTKCNEIKHKVTDKITARPSDISDKAILEDLLVNSKKGQCARCISAKYAIEYIGNIVHDCNAMCIESQSGTTSGEFSLTINPDSFLKACEERRCADFILKEIAKVPDILTRRTCFVQEQIALILASLSTTSASCEEETLESVKPLICSAIHAEEEPIDPAIQSVCSSRHLMRDSECLDTSVCISTSDIQITPSIQDLEALEDIPSFICVRRDIAVNTVDSRKKKPSIEIPSTTNCCYESNDILPTISREKPSIIRKEIIATNNDIPPTDTSKQKTAVIKQEIIATSDIPPTYISKQKPAVIKKATIVSAVKTFQTKEKPIKIAKDVFQESLSPQDKKTKYRTKYRIPEKEIPESKKIHNDSDKVKKYEYFFFAPKILKTRSCTCFTKSAIEMHQDCQCKPLNLQSAEYYKDLIPNTYFERFKYCNDSITPRLSFRDETVRNATSNQSFCLLPQNSYTIQHCHSLSNASSKHNYNINDCTKRRITFENLLRNDTYCKNNAGYCYSHVNNIGNVRMGYYHDSCPTWNNSQHCGMDRSCYWTKGNLYFIHR